MHIAILSWRDTTHPDGGGSEVFLESVGTELARRGHRVTLVCARYPGARARETREGIDVRRLGGRLSVYVLGLVWLVRHRRDVDVVVDVVNGLPFAAPLVRRRGVVALVHHVHAEQWRIIYPDWRGRVGWFVESRVVPRLYRGRAVLTVSDASRRDLQSLGVDPGHVTVVRNGRAPAPPVAADPTPTPRLSTLARLVPHKQIEHAFTVLARLAPVHPGIHLDVIGEGWWHERLVAAARAQGVSERVTFHGHVSDARRDELLARSWVMVMPSVKEGWCLAVTEAGAQGVPTVAYRFAGGVTESVEDHRTGLLVDDLDGLVAGVGTLLRDAGLRGRLGAAARRKADALTWSACTDAVERVLASAASR